MKRIGLWLGVASVGLMGTVERVNAQAVVSDGTLNTIVNASNTREVTITGGTTSGTNLFHSFREFSIPTGSSAFFNHAADVQNIFSRVTGGTASSIDGMIRANGTANLFLLNPAGLLFGANAQLNIGGSFVGTTAQSIKFANGTEFSTTNLMEKPLLTMSVPIGLQVGANPSPITVQGNGHQLQSVATTRFPYSRNDSGGLQVAAGKTLALLGGDVLLTGGILTSPQGRVELGAVEAGQVKLNLTDQGLSFNYDGITNFRNIRLAQRALVDVSGAPSGSVQLQGRKVNLQDSSVIWLQNRGTTQGGDIEIQATERLELNGFTPNSNFVSDAVSAIYMEPTGSGAGGNIRITTPQLMLSNGAEIEYRNFSTLLPGDIQIKASEFVRLDEIFTLTRTSRIISTVLGQGQGSNVMLSTPLLELRNGGLVSALTASTSNQGNGGNVTVNADRIIVDGVGRNIVSSALGTSSLGTGNAGNVTLNTRTLTINDSGVVPSSGFGRGNAGTVTVNATEAITLSGRRSESLRPSQIASTVAVPPLLVQQVYNLPKVPTGAAGGVTINTPKLIVTDRARITVGNDGVGNGGILSIDAGSIQLDDRASLTAATNIGEGGNIALVSDSLILRHNSRITTSSQTIGRGGDITIEAPVILGLENSDIIANAAKGRGGRIQITTQGIFGLEYRDLLNPRDVLTNDITASSEIDVNGTVQVNHVGVDPNSGLVALPANLNDPSQDIAKGCQNNQGSSFVISGRGGIPKDFSQGWRDRTWQDLRPRSESRQASIVEAALILVEATKWERDRNGKVQLIAAHPVPSNLEVTCALRAEHNSAGIVP